jgi:hypothetical protein
MTLAEVQKGYRDDGDGDDSLSWAPTQDKMPAEIQEMIDYAASKNVKLMGYVYPCLDFVSGSGVPSALLGHFHRHLP